MHLRPLENGVFLTCCFSPSLNSQAAPGVYSAREFVWWYNGHPSQAGLPIDLRSVQSVAVVGLGNVALDCARVLLQPPERLASTDIAEHALRTLRRSAVTDVHVIGRRGPVQVGGGNGAKESWIFLGHEP